MSSATSPNIPANLAFPATEQLTDLQSHMKKLCAHFSWETTTEKTFLLFVEEVGELAKAIRNTEKLFQEKSARDPDAVRENLAEEFADVFSYLLDLANSYDIDIGEAYVRKMSANFGRTWE